MEMGSSRTRAVRCQGARHRATVSSLFYLSSCQGACIPYDQGSVYPCRSSSSRLPPQLLYSHRRRRLFVVLLRVCPSSLPVPQPPIPRSPLASFLRTGASLHPCAFYLFFSYCVRIFISVHVSRSFNFETMYVCRVNPVPRFPTGTVVFQFMGVGPSFLKIMYVCRVK